MKAGYAGELNTSNPSYLYDGEDGVYTAEDIAIKVIWRKIQRGIRLYYRKTSTSEKRSHCHNLSGSDADFSNLYVPSFAGAREN